MSDRQNTDPSVSTFVSSIVFTAGVSAAVFILFMLIRSRIPRVYAPKTYIGPEHERSTELRKGPFGWITGSRMQSENEFIDRCGLDAYMFIEFLSKSFYLFVGFAILAIPILIPLNCVDQLGLEGLNQFTIANIKDQKRLWAHLVLTVLFSVATLSLGMYSIREYIIRRQNYLMNARHSQSLQATTILVCGIPKGEDSLPALNNVFNAFPGGVKRIWLAYAAPELQKDITKRNAITSKLEAAECSLIRAKLKHHSKHNSHSIQKRRSSETSTLPLSSENDPDKESHLAYSDELSPSESRPRHRPATFPMTLFASCCGAEKVDSIETYRSEIVNMNASILARQRAGMTNMREGKDENKMRAAFIQFNDQMGAHLATQAVVHQKKGIMRPRHLEVHPTDVLWDNLNFSLKLRNTRKAVSIILELILIIFWTVPVTFVAAISQLDTIVTYAPFLSGVYDLPTAVVGIIQGILPPIGLALLMMVLPIILYKLAHFGGVVLKTRKTLSVVTSYHWFSVVQVILVTTFANGAFAAVNAIKADPSSVMTMLSASLPQASTFYLSYILLSLINIPLLLIQIGPLISYLIGKRFSSTPRKMFAAETTLQSVDWGMTIPVHTISFSIGLLYSTIQPFILPLMIIYFGLFYLAFRYMFLYVYRQPFDSGGLIFPRIIDQVYVGVILFEVVMLGLFILQKAVGQSVVMFIVFLLSLSVIIISRHYVFKTKNQYLPEEAFDTNRIAAAENGNRGDGSIISVNSVTNVSNALDAAATASHLNAGEKQELEQQISVEAINPIPPQGSFHEKAPYRDPSSPRLEPETRELYSPNSSVQPSLKLDELAQHLHLHQHSQQPQQQQQDQNTEGSFVEHQSNQSPLPSIVLERAAEPAPLSTSDMDQIITENDTSRTAFMPTMETSDNNNNSNNNGNNSSNVSMTHSQYNQLLGSQLGEQSGGGGSCAKPSSSLQVLGANQSFTSTSNPVADSIVPEALTYANPALWKQCHSVWLPKDPRGFVEMEMVELTNTGIDCTTDCAAMDMKGKITVDVARRDLAPGEERWE